ncbi:hypothetical protein F9K33_12435 [bacterium]|nr:MAG: hypothetical protein F9K33_12435 [bacterium]
MKIKSLLFGGCLIASIACVVYSNSASSIEGWHMAGTNPKDYDLGKDTKIFHSGKSSAFMQSNKETIQGFGTLMQTIKADSYLGKRVRMTGYIKVDNINGMAAMWMRVDSKDTPPIQLSFDNMSNRGISSASDWKKCEIVLNVPANSGAIAFGVLLRGTGKIWFDDVQFEAVDLSVATTEMNMAPQFPSEPVNLGFEK